MTEVRSRVSVLIINNNQFVLIFRHKKGQDYYAVPGGGIEPGETPKQAAVREIYEELGFSIQDIRRVSEVKTTTRHDYNFLAKTNEINFSVTGPEIKHLNTPEDLFKPEWYSKDVFLHNLPIFPKSSRKMVEDYINN